MTIRDIAYLRTKYKRGDKPTQQDFYDWLESLSVDDYVEVNISNASQSISPTKGLVYVKSSTGLGHITLTSNPQILVSVAGHKIILTGTSNIDYITINDGNGLSLKSSCDLKLNESICLQYSTIYNYWIELFRSSGSIDSSSFALADGTRPFTGEVSLSNHKITNVLDPQYNQDVATKKYVDEATGIIKYYAISPSTANRTGKLVCISDGPLVDLTDAKTINKMPAIGVIIHDGDTSIAARIASGDVQNVKVDSTASSIGISDKDNLFVSDIELGKITNIPPTILTHVLQRIGQARENLSEGNIDIIWGPGEIIEL